MPLDPEGAAWFQTPTMPDGAGYRLRADANGDDCVDDADLGIVLEYYGCEAPWTGACAGGEAADLNEDGIVDDTDLAWVSEDYGAFAWLYEYDVYGNLVYAGSPCVGEYEAAYDAFGRRVWERIAATGQSAIETHFVYDGDALVLELSPSGQPLVQYVWGLLGPIARVDLQNGSNTRYYVLDARGHARALVDSSGAVTDYYEYDAWGNVLPGSFGSTPNPFRWNAAGGYQHIPFTGLYHVGAREYDPRTARWLQRDPIGQSSGDPNLYRYCFNNPVDWCDPSGLQGRTRNGLIFPAQQHVNASDWRWPEPTLYKDLTKFSPIEYLTVLAGKAAYVKANIALIMECTNNAFLITNKHFAPGTLGQVNGPMDAFRHCVWACLVRKRLGSFGFIAVVIDHEADNAPWAKGQWDATSGPMDLANDFVGLKCFSSSKSCEGACLDALANGELYTLPRRFWK